MGHVEQAVRKQMMIRYLAPLDEVILGSLFCVPMQTGVHGPITLNPKPCTTYYSILLLGLAWADDRKP